MSSVDKFGLGCGLFVGFFALVTIGLPKSAFTRYYADLSMRGKTSALRFLVSAVFVLAIPYFYDLLVGWNNDGLSLVLALFIGLAALLVLADVSWFVFRTYGPRKKP